MPQTPEELQALRDEFADKIAERMKSGSGRWGIGNASVYLKDIAGCFDADGWPRDFPGRGKSGPEQWAEALKNADRRLTYCNEEMDFFELDAKRTGTKLSEGSVMDFAAVITTTKQDRDGDILVSKGATVDPNAPLLWQHMPFEPIGVVRDSRIQAKKVTGKFSIIDSPLGRDAAQLVEFGALRISHGFQVFDFEPLDDDERGFKISEFEIMEVSLVSVPSNTDAVITAFSREKLHHPFVKQWAAAKFAARPVQKQGINLEAAVKSMEMDRMKTTTIIEERLGDYANKTTTTVEPAVAPLIVDTKTSCVCDPADDAIEAAQIAAFKNGVLPMAAPLIIKGGRALSKANEKQLRDALDMMKRISENDDATPSIKTLCQGAIEKLESVIKAVEPDETEASASELFTRAFLSAGEDTKTLKLWLGNLESAIARIDANQLEQEAEALLN